MEELTDDEQLELWHELWLFATKKLPQATTLNVFIVSKPLAVIGKARMIKTRPNEAKENGFHKKRI